MFGINLNLGASRVPLIGSDGGSKAPPPAPPFNANAVNFDGTNDFLGRDADLTGAVDGKQAIISLWFKLIGDDVNPQTFLGSTGQRIQITRRSALDGNDILFAFLTPAGAVAWNGLTTTTFTVASADWLHFLISLDSATGDRTIHINDTLDAIISETFNLDALIDMTHVDWHIGSLVAESNKITAELAEVYYTNEFLDFSVVANRRKFIDAAGKPVDLGLDGSDPTGTAALIYQSGATAAWHTNKGTGGGFTENGALTDAASSPSD